jgi:predicted O-methyltransferase YrrM
MLIKILDFIKKAYFKKKYNYYFFEKKQNLIFKKLSFDRFKAIKKLNEIYTIYPFLKNNMQSEHGTLFSAISLKTKKIKILEIGTHDGKNAYLLSKLFPKSSITTIDLPNNDKNFRLTYNRKEQLFKFCKSRDKMIKKSKNIIFKKINSLNLIFCKEKFDLIWIDGAHGYPVVVSDIINSIKLLNSNGIILCDDIFLDNIPIQDNIYASVATFETLKNLVNAGIINYKLIYKRLDINNNSNPNFRKFIGFVKINKNQKLIQKK